MSAGAAPHGADEPGPARWYSGVRSALGYHFEVWVPRERDFAATFASLLDDIPTAPAHDMTVDHFEIRRHVEPASFGLYLNGSCLATGEIGAHFAHPWTWNLNQQAIATGSTKFVVLHAACVTRGGVTVVLPADMESGKSTTAVGLLRSGYDYVTDEATALIPETGQVMPYPKPLSLDPGSWSLFPELAHQHVRQRQQWPVTARSLGSHAHRQPVAAPRAVVFPAYRGGAATTAEPCTSAQALFELCRMTFGFAAQPRRALHVLARLVRHASCTRLVIGDLDEAIHAIDDIVSTTILEDL